MSDKKALFDKDGYPSKKSLRVIASWDAIEDMTGLLIFVKDLWQWEDYYKCSGNHLELHTGGWSGNEAIISALQKNFMFWSLCWMKSERGGHYYFELSVKAGAESGNQVTGKAGVEISF